MKRVVYQGIKISIIDIVLFCVGGEEQRVLRKYYKSMTAGAGDSGVSRWRWCSPAQIRHPQASGAPFDGTGGHTWPSGSGSHDHVVSTLRGHRCRRFFGRDLAQAPQSVGPGGEMPGS